MPSPDWLPPSFLHPQPIPAQASCKRRQKWPYLFLPGAVCPKDLPHGRQGWSWVGVGGHCFLGSCMPAWPAADLSCPGTQGWEGMGEILGVKGFKGQQVVAVFPHPTLCSSLCGLSSQLERLYRPQTWRRKRTLGPGASSAGFQTRCELKDLLQLSLVIQVLQDWSGGGVPFAETLDAAGNRHLL